MHWLRRSVRFLLLTTLIIAYSRKCGARWAVRTDATVETSIFMVDRNIIGKLGLTHEQIEKEVNELFQEEHSELLAVALEKKIETLIPGTILAG